MALKYGELERREGDNNGSLEVAYMGMINAPDIVTGEIAIIKKAKTVGNEWPWAVKIRSGGAWAELGSAKFERKNSAASHYMNVVIESPSIFAKMGGPLWLKAFPDGDDAGKEPKATNYDLVWSAGGKRKAASGGDDFKLDDSIPFS